jgi:signal transduction histidine kinase/AraC-like DNA-binding protein
VVRRSCGCSDARVAQAAVGTKQCRGTHTAWPDPLVCHQLQIDIHRSLGAAGANLDPRWAASLLDAFLADLALRVTQDAAERFVRDLEELLSEAATAGMNILACHNAISALRQGLLPYLTGSMLTLAEDLWHQARVVIGQAASRTEAKQVWSLLHSAQALYDLESGLHIAFDMETLLDVLVDHLPRLGITRCYLALYDEPHRPDGLAQLVLAYDGENRLPLLTQGAIVSSRQIMSEMLPPGRNHSLALQALYFGQEVFGFLVMEIEPAAGRLLGSTYETLRSQISSALKGLRLHEEVEKARRQAEEANALKSRFLSMVSHELRTPLSLIIGLSETASWERTRLSARDSGSQLGALNHYQEQIYRSAQHLDRLIRDVLDLASSQVGQLQLTLRPLDLRPLLDRVTAEGEYMAREKRLAWRYHTPGALPLVSADETRLRQVLLNLLSNSVKFTAQGEISLSVAVDDQWISVSVSDTGLGIPFDQQESVFDEFHQPSHATARTHGGMGLGLAITRRLVDMHGGRIWVRSTGEEGQGSTFTFTLPVFACATDPVSVVAPAETKPIILLTDQIGNCDLLQRHLADCGLLIVELLLDEVRYLHDRLHDQRPSAILLDLAPASDRAWEIVRLLKEHPDTQDLPVLFCSQFEEQGDNPLLAMNYLHRPIGSAALASALTQAGVRVSAELRSPVILIVDDEAALADIHAQIVRNYLPGCRVITALNGGAALEIIQAEAPDLILLDLLMPEMDGFTLIEKLQAGEISRKIPVIVLTGRTLEKEEMDRLQKGVTAVLGKGLFTVEETLEQIGTALAHAKRQDDPGRRLARQAIAFIQANYAESITRSDIARHLGLSERHFNHCFRQEVGIPPMVYLTRFRLQQAQRLLAHSDMSITDIALTVGFSSPAYFTRLFQREYEVSPSSYRRSV